jgi:hypothetical protein
LSHNIANSDAAEFQHASGMGTCTDLSQFQLNIEPVTDGYFADKIPICFTLNRTALVEELVTRSLFI